MSYDIPSISELEAIQLLNKHYAEVITSKKDGVSSAADITQTTNPITGVTRRTLYKILDDAQIEHDAQITAHEVEHDNQMQSFENDFDSRLAGMAFTRVGSFTTGAKLTDMRQVLIWEVSQGGDGHEYGWAGSFSPSGKVVIAGSNPGTTGGIGAGAWVDRTDVTLRDEITPSVTEALRRSYAEAGYNLVDGSFEAGGTLVNANDVLLQERTGKAFSGPAGTVAAGTDPSSGGFVDKSGVATSASAISNAKGGSVQDFIDSQTFDNVDTMLAFNGLQVGQSVKTLGYYAAGDGGHAEYIIKTTAAASADGDVIDSYGNHNLNSGHVAILQLDDSVICAQFGCSPSVDNTKRIQAALDMAESKGRTTVILPAGKLQVQLGSSSYTYEVLQIPKNITLRGAGKYATTLCEFDGQPVYQLPFIAVLLVNKRYDTTSNYNADGNITIEHMRIESGQTDPMAGVGNLVGFGNTRGMVIQDCSFGDHRWHAVDICKSRDCKILRCHSENKVPVPTVNNAEPFQIDAGAMGNIFQGPTRDCYDIDILDNVIINVKSTHTINFHTAVFAININIKRNYISLAEGNTSTVIIGADSNCGFENININENIFITQSPQQAVLEILLDDSTLQCANFNFCDNYIAGKLRAIARIGTISKVGPNFYGSNLQNVNMSGNNCAVTFEHSATMYGFESRYFRSAKIDNNTIRFTYSGTRILRVITDHENASCSISSNTVLQSLVAPGTGQLFGIGTSSSEVATANEDKSCDINENTVHLRSGVCVAAGHNPADHVGYTKYHSVIRNNQLLGVAAVTKIYETYPTSDGTNNLQYVDFISGGEPTNRTLLNVTPGKKVTVYFQESRKAGPYNSQNTFKLMYSQTTDTSKMAPVVNGVNVGTIITDVDVLDGRAILRTGSLGISKLINDAFTEVNVTSGYVNLMVGI